MADSNDSPKNDSENTNTQTEKFVHGKLVEPYIYCARNKKKYKHYDVHFYLVINGRQVNRKKANIKGIQNARNQLKEFQRELWELRLKAKNNDRKWKDAKELAYRRIETKIKLSGTVSSELDDIKGTLEKHTKKLDEKWLSDITRVMIQDHVEALTNDKGEPLAPATKQKIFGHVTRVFNHNDWTKHNNPANGLKPHAWREVQKNRKSEVGLSHEEVYKLIEHVKKRDRQWYYIISFAFFLGARSAELYALKFENIIRDQNGKPERINIEYSWSWKKKALKRPKNGQARTVYLNKSMVELISEIEQNKSDAFFILPRVPDWKNGKASVVIRKLLVEAGIIKPVKVSKSDSKKSNHSEKDWFRFHDLRACTASLALDRNLPIKAVSEHLGHSSLRSLDYYWRKSDEKIQKAVVDSLEFDHLKQSSKVVDLVKHKKKAKKA